MAPPWVPPDCDTPLKANGSHTRTFRTVFGTLKRSSPRLFYCRCRRRKTTSFRPLAALLPESVAPALLCMETKGSSLVSAHRERGCHWGQQQVFPQAKDGAERTSLRHSEKRNTQITQGMRLIYAARSALIVSTVVLGPCRAVAPYNPPQLVKQE